MRLSVIVLMLLVSTGCGFDPKTGNLWFSFGTRPKSVQVVATPEPEPPDIEPHVSDPPTKAPPNLECGEHGITQAKLLTPTVANGRRGNYVEYELSLADCDGKGRTLVADVILFDVDATARYEANTTYTLTSDQGKVTGQLTRIDGADLFGNTGRYFHHRTDQRVSVSTTTTTVKLRIDLNGEMFNLRGKETFFGFGPPAAEITIPTYLRFGDAAPVRKDVVFKR